MTVNEMKARVKFLIFQREDINKEIKDLQQKIAESQAKFSVGDRVTYEGAKNVWQITGIYLRWGNVAYKAAKIKKNGEPYLQSGDLYIPYGKELVIA